MPRDMVRPGLDQDESLISNNTIKVDESREEKSEQVKAAPEQVKPEPTKEEGTPPRPKLPIDMKKRTLPAPRPGVPTPANRLPGAPPQPQPPAAKKETKPSEEVVEEHEKEPADLPASNKATGKTDQPEAADAQKDSEPSRPAKVLRHNPFKKTNLASDEVKEKDAETQEQSKPEELAEPEPKTATAEMSLQQDPRPDSPEDNKPTEEVQAPPAPTQSVPQTWRAPPKGLPIRPPPTQGKPIPRTLPGPRPPMKTPQATQPAPEGQL